mmetsp:Transcript_23248/g.35894  ORF Transcript_23248/g.35894 Transcript_23248/m.35894 type:complete len:192 (+) Transcript_23248:76-651(+)
MKLSLVDQAHMCHLYHTQNGNNNPQCKKFIQNFFDKFQHNMRYKLPSASTFRRWLIKYEDGIYDGFLCSMGLVRKSSVIQPTRSVIKRKVLAELVLKDFTKLVSISDTEVLEILVGVEASMGIDHSKRSKSWINNIKLVAQKTKVKELMKTGIIADKVETSTEMDLVGEVELSPEIDGTGEDSISISQGWF